MMIFLAFLALLIPGLAFWAWFGKRKQDPILSLAQIIGISLAIIILIAEFAFFLGVSFSLASILITLLIFTALAVLGFIKKGVKIRRRDALQLGIGVLLFLGIIGWRLFQARELLLPNWVDSQHHYLIIKAIIEQRGLPKTLEPYLAVPFYYHYGFHAIAAFFTVISRLEIGQAMLLLGQVLNAAICLSIYALGKEVWKDWRPALGAALLVGFVLRMPAYYLSWGRYTLITGLIFLPLAMATALQLVKGKNRGRNTLILALFTAGILLSHYFAAVLLAFFLILLALVYLVPRLKKIKKAIKAFISLPLAVLFGLFLAAPWLTRVIQYSQASTSIGVNLPESLESIRNFSGNFTYVLNLLGPTSNHVLAAVALVGIAFALVQHKATWLILWTLALGFLTLPWGLTLGPFRTDHFAIVLFIPVSLFAGWLFWQGGVWLDQVLKTHWVRTVLLLVVILGWAAWAFPVNSNLINPVTEMVTEADMDALDWIRKNTPEDARFFINTVSWLDNTYRGVDGGGWILPYTGRWALVPTTFYGYSPNPETISQIQLLGKNASQITTCSDAFWELVEEADLEWVYIREGIGGLQPEGLMSCEAINLAYENGQVSIYRINH
jgi:hypothetical protein